MDAPAAEQIARALRPIPFSHTFEIADLIKRQLATAPAAWPLINEVGRVEYDLHPTEGYLVSTKKTVRALCNGRWYRITVEEEQP